jgi:hypothetical protein
MKTIVILFIALVTSLHLQAQGDDHKSGDSNDYCVQSDGNKIYIIYKGIAIMADVVLNNGTTVKTDATLTTKDGKTSVLRVGQCIDQEGTISTPGNDLNKQRKLQTY